MNIIIEAGLHNTTGYEYDNVQKCVLYPLYLKQNICCVCVLIFVRIE